MMLSRLGAFLALLSFVFPTAADIHRTAAVAPTAASEPISCDQALSARSFRVVDFDSGRALADCRSGEPRGIASLTKIMTAYVALQHLDPYDTITLTPEMLDTEGAAGAFRTGETFTVRDLIAAAMIFSSNDAAMALATATETKTDASFITEMNDTAVKLGMLNTSFSNPIGLDREDKSISNLSSASDLAIFVRRIYHDQPLIWELSRDAQRRIYSRGGSSHDLFNINELAPRIPHFIGGKTGSTDAAGESLVILYEDPLGSPKALILLGAEAGKRFTETEFLLRKLTNVLP